jgi:glycosyltransferase involved in cell wall biosynthesis
VRVLLALTYYRPHLSGLTLYVERLARALVTRGHEVTVLTSQHDSALARESREDGVRVVRAPVVFRAVKGVLMRSYGRSATRLLRSHDVLSIHVPQLEAASLALRARLLHRPAVLTYHCDLQLPPGALNRVADRVVAGSNFAAAALATQIVAYTADYADSVALLRRFRAKVEIVPPPVVMPLPDDRAVESFRRRYGLAPEGTRRPTIGMAARFATEKGVDVLLDALPILQSRFPDLQVLFAGPHDDIPGEETYRAGLAPAIEALGDRWRFLGPLEPASEMPSFLAALDCLVVASVNSTESFGLVQVEAMLSGTPVVASALPGVRDVIRTTGMGEVVAPGDPVALADAVGRVVDGPERYERPRAEIEQMYDLDATVERYEELFVALLRAADRRRRAGPSSA